MHRDARASGIGVCACAPTSASDCGFCRLSRKQIGAWTQAGSLGCQRSYACAMPRAAPRASLPAARRSAARPGRGARAPAGCARRDVAAMRVRSLTCCAPSRATPGSTRTSMSRPRRSSSTNDPYVDTRAPCRQHRCRCCRGRLPRVECQAHRFGVTPAPGRQQARLGGTACSALDGYAPSASGLDPRFDQRAAALLEVPGAAAGVSYHFITHRISVADFVAVMRVGKIEEQGGCSEVLARQRRECTRAELTAGLCVRATVDQASRTGG